MNLGRLEDLHLGCWETSSVILTTPNKFVWKIALGYASSILDLQSMAVACTVPAFDRINLRSFSAAQG